MMFLLIDTIKGGSWFCGMFISFERGGIGTLECQSGIFCNLSSLCLFPFPLVAHLDSFYEVAELEKMPYNVMMSLIGKT